MAGRRQTHGNEYQLRKYGNMYGGSQGFPREIRDEQRSRQRYGEQESRQFEQQPFMDDEDFDGGMYGDEDSENMAGNYRRGTSSRREQSMTRGQDTGYGRSGMMRQDSERNRDSSTQSRGGFRGRGPKGYRRSDERIVEEVNELLTDHDELDAENIEVSVADGEVTLSGTVSDRQAKRLAEDLADDVSGVQEVHNQLRIQRGENMSGGNDKVEAEKPRAGKSDKNK